VIIVPELQKVFILVPRTGSGSLYRELHRVYPRSMLLYRHMEADGCPRGYDRWQRVGFVRHPLMRLWSLFRFMQQFTESAHTKDIDEARRIQEQTRCGFETWLLHNDAPFTKAHDLVGTHIYRPIMCRINGAPENKCSQYDYLRPDLGTLVLKFENLREHMTEWGLSPTLRKNHIGNPPPPLSPAISDHIARYCAWDLEQHCAFI